MAIEFQPNRYFIGIWFIHNGKEDCLVTVYRDKDSRYWNLVWRFRYYAEEKVWDSKDKKVGIMQQLKMLLKKK